MSNKTYIPAFRANVGDWNYYICKMKYAEVARSVGFAHELGGHRDLSDLIQRGLSDRTEEIARYLLESEHRFLGSLIVAAWGGEPEYTYLEMENGEGLLEGLDQGFGVLTFDGTHSFFALDGQHRLKAIKDALMQNPDLGSEDICVLLVTHYDSEEGRLKTRRLFTNINRNAKATSKGENIALDVDDACAVITRDLLTEHEFLSAAGRVRVFSSTPSSDGSFKLATNVIPKTDPFAWTSITALYEIVKALTFDADAAVHDPNMRPSDAILSSTFELVSIRINELLEACGDIGPKLQNSSSAKELRLPTGEGGESHPMMRPVVQLCVVRTLSSIVQEDRLDWANCLARLRALSWELEEAPWHAVFNEPTGRMITGKEHSGLLEQLLRVHVQPSSLEEIRRVRRGYRDLFGNIYPASEADLAQLLAKD